MNKFTVNLFPTKEVEGPENYLKVLGITLDRLDILEDAITVAIFKHIDEKSMVNMTFTELIAAGSVAAENANELAVVVIAANHAYNEISYSSLPSSSVEWTDEERADYYKEMTQQKEEARAERRAEGTGYIPGDFAPLPTPVNNLKAV